MASPCPRVLWKWAVSSTSPPSAAAGGREVGRDLRGVGHPGRVAEPDLLRPGLDQPPRDREHALLGHVALVRAAEGDGDDALAAQPLLPGAAQHALEPAQRLLDRAVDVLAVVRLRGGEEHVDLVEAVAVGERVLEPLLVRDQHGERDAFGRVDRPEHLPRVGELRDHVGAHEARHLEAAQPGAREHVDQPHLVGRGDHLGLVLEPVARPHLADPDVVHRQDASFRRT